MPLAETARATGDRRFAAGGYRVWYPLSALVRRDVRKRYAASTFGAAWTVLQPLLLLALYVAVFAFILRSGRDERQAREFSLYLLAGMLPYLALNEGIQRASFSLREDRSLMDREVFPAEVIPLARVVTATLGEAVGLVLLVILAAFAGKPPTIWLVTLPLLIGARAALTCGIAWAVSTLSIFVTDLGEVLSLILTAWLFLTPIFYAADAAPAALRWTFALNPLHHLVRAYRDVLIDGRAPIPSGLAAIAAATLAAAAGLWFFRATIDRGKDLL